MAISDAVWGIDIGQCALKALKCAPSDHDERIEAEAFDYVEYSQILSQPDADPAALIADALKTFLSRNKVKGDRVAVSVSGQNGLARFIKIPPVEAKKIPDLVKYEAKQQIPFALEEVIWDYQRMPGGVEEEGYCLDTEVGLFAMKREQVFKALKPLQDAGIEVDFVQLAPLSIYNFVNFDQLGSLLPKGEENGTKWVVVLSMGTDTTDLVVTNGARVWQRSIPLGGNHFTKALTKELKLTFGKAEHLKRNATKAEDPKALYQAMRGVFNDLVTEVHRSLSYFSSLEKEADIKCVLAMGNTLKLQGLQNFLAKSLEYKVVGVDQFRNLEGPSVVGSPAFKDNLLAYGVCYGLCIQGLGESKIHTNLLPQEILTERIIRAKKPWAVAAVAAVLIGLTVNYFGHWRPASLVQKDDYKQVFGQIEGVVKVGGELTSAESGKKADFKTIEQIGQQLSAPTKRLDAWSDLLFGVNACLPSYGAKNPPPEIEKRELIYIDNFDAVEVEKLETWYQGITSEKDKKIYTLPTLAKGKQAPKPAEGGAPADAAAAPDAIVGPKGEGWVIQLTGHHFFNKDPERFGKIFVRDDFLAKLADEDLQVDVPELDNGVPVVGKDGKVKTTKIKLKALGISYPVLITKEDIKPAPHPDAGQATKPVGPPLGGAPVAADKPRTIDRFDFKIQFAWPGTTRVEPPKASPTATATAATHGAGGE